MTPSEMNKIGFLIAVAAGAAVRDIRHGRALAEKVVAEATQLPEDRIPGGLHALEIDTPEDAAAQYVEYQYQLGPAAKRNPPPGWLEHIKENPDL